VGGIRIMAILYYIFQQFQFQLYFLYFFQSYIELDIYDTSTHKYNDTNIEYPEYCDIWTLV